MAHRKRAAFEQYEVGSPTNLGKFNYMFLEFHTTSSLRIPEAVRGPGLLRVVKLAKQIGLVWGVS